MLWATLAPETEACALRPRTARRRIVLDALELTRRRVGRFRLGLVAEAPSTVLKHTGSTLSAYTGY